ncbi:MAG: thiol protease/hemagglutinin PrtT [Bacteroidetes bacterium]|nr:thiol protease/hemagglutinin PrtT [Bacteroidota bacterium]
MKRFTSFLFASLVFFQFTYGKQVDEKTARTVGQNFLTGQVHSRASQGSNELALVQTVYSEYANRQGSGSELVCYYIFNSNSSKGFIIVSGDDNVKPVLAYSDEVGFDVTSIAPDVAYWLNGYKEQIEELIQNNIPASSEVKSCWEELKSGSVSKTGDKSVHTVSPLEQTTWDQSPYYNAMCPFDNTYSERTVTGCVATGMAQIMKFWGAPANGAGFHSYTDPKYGTLSADFGSTTYDWNSMPLSVNGSNTAVAKLIYECGVSVDMHYGVGSTGGSSAYVISSQSPVQSCAEYAFKTYFGYSGVQGVSRSAYLNKPDWVNLLKAELDAGRPILYAGFGNGGGHCFNCDGYDANNFFHFNWGWSGQFDGYFDVDALDPTGTGTGGGTGGFNSGQQAVIGIQGPGGSSQSSALSLFDNVAASPSNIEYGDTFTVHTNILNNTNQDFNGEFCAAIFDNNGIFVDYVEVLTGMSLQAGYHYTNGLTFSSSGILTMLPGSYSVGIFYSPGGDNLWIQVSDTLGFTNFPPMTVHHSNTIELYSAMALTPGATLIQGQAVSVHLDVLNTGTTAFNGTFDVSLYDLSGYAVFTVQQITGNNLPANNHYINGLTFASSNITCDPGTYLLAIQYLPDGPGQGWQLTGSTDYQNPIQVIVQQAPFTADSWEPNNSPAQASALPLTFSGNNATVNTTGSNISNTSASSVDYDYYKIDLPSGYSYTITARLNDSKSSGNGQSYTEDAIFSYSTDGATFSDPFDDVMANSIVSPNGGTIYFLVSPKFTGTAGTYLLDLSVTRNPLGIEDPSVSVIRIYPNPVKDVLHLDLSSFNGNFNQIQVVNVEGKRVSDDFKASGRQDFSIPVDKLADGIYFLQMIDASGMYSRKFVIRR